MDIVQGTSTTPLMMTGLLKPPDVAIPQWLCSVTGILAPAMLFLSFHILTLMALERYCYFAMPFKHGRLFSTKKIIVVEVILWCFSLTFSTTIHVTKRRTYYDVVLMCQSPTAGLFIYAQLVLYILPAIGGITFAIVKLWRLRRQHQAQLKTRTHMENSRAENRIKKTSAAIRIIVLISGLFWITYLPPALFRLVVFANGSTWEKLDDFSQPNLSYAFRYFNMIIFTLSSALNPFIYLLSHRELRRPFWCRYGAINDAQFTGQSSANIGSTLATVEDCRNQEDL